jgi:hypothetical protein
VPMSRAVSRRARKRKPELVIAGVTPRKPNGGADLVEGRLAPNWLPNWHPTFGALVVRSVRSADMNLRSAIRAVWVPRIHWERLRAAIATKRASLGSEFWHLPDPNRRTREVIIGRTSITRSSAVGIPDSHPRANSTALARSGYPDAHGRSFPSWPVVAFVECCWLIGSFVWRGRPIWTRLAE